MVIGRWEEPGHVRNPKAETVSDHHERSGSRAGVDRRVADKNGQGADASKGTDEARTAFLKAAEEAGVFIRPYDGS
jgi:hypothetical protein